MGAVFVWVELHTKQTIMHYTGTFIQRPFKFKEGGTFKTKNKQTMKTNFKKSDLKNGWIAEIRGGSRNYKENLHRVFIDEENYHLVNDEGYISLLDYREDLTYEGDCKRDIMKVYEPTTIKGLVCFNRKSLIWKREENRKLTMSELREIVGEPFEIIE